MDLSGKNVVFVAGFGGIGTEPYSKIGKLMYFMCASVLLKRSRYKLLSPLLSVKCIDALVNGAISSDPNIKATVNVSLLGLINTTTIALLYMDKTQHRRGGLILNIASVLGFEPCAPLVIIIYNMVYSSSKFGVIGFPLSMSVRSYQIFIIYINHSLSSIHILLSVLLLQ
ncbi:alcohol dehydrogenase 2-like [Glossina fuscipes fuscipes]